MSGPLVKKEATVIGVPFSLVIGREEDGLNSPSTVANPCLLLDPLRAWVPRTTQWKTLACSAEGRALLNL